MQIFVFFYIIEQALKLMRFFFFLRAPKVLRPASPAESQCSPYSGQTELSVFPSLAQPGLAGTPESLSSPLLFLGAN